MLRLAEKVSHFAGLQVCGSPWACPVCAAKIAGARVTEVARAIQAHEDQGGGVAHLIGTFSHHQGDSLGTLLYCQQKAWQGLTKSRCWQALRKDYGVGFIRFREITWGEANGWHPHFHAAFLTDRKLTEEERVTVEAELRAEWLRQLENVGLSGIGSRALRLEAWNGGQHLAEYLTKQGVPSIQVETAKSLGLEVAGAAFKRGRADKGLTPWDLLALAAEGDAAAYERWCEYEAATKGKRTNFWSDGLRARLLGVEDERTDDELATLEVGGQDVAGLWPEARRAIWAASPGGVDLLEACERSVNHALAYLATHAPPGSWFAAGAEQDMHSVTQTHLTG